MWKKSAILAGILTALSSIVYWYEFSAKPKKEEEAELTKQPFSLKDKTISEIFITDGEKAFRFKCLDIDKKLCKSGDASKWLLTEPQSMTADDSNLQALVSGLANLVSQEKISLLEETPETRDRLIKEYGLSPTSRRFIKVKLADGTEQTVYLGNTHPIGEAFFSATEKEKGKINFDTIFLIPSHFKVNFEHDLTYWRNKRVVPIQSYEVSSFTLKNSKGTIKADRKNGIWTLNNELPGDIENIDNMLSSVMNTSARDFLTRSVIPTGVPQAEITFYKDKSEPLTLKIYRTKLRDEKTKKLEDRTIETITGSDPVYLVDAAQFDRVNIDAEKLRFSKLITSTERFATKGISFTGKVLGNPISLELRDKKWVSTTDPKEQVVQDNVNKILERLSGNRVQAFLKEPGKSSAIQDQAIEISISEDLKAAPKRKILIWKSGSNLFARDLLSKRVETFKLDNLLDDALPWKRETLIK